MLDARPIAVSTGVVCFFALSIAGSIAGLSPYVCCERALLGSVVAYLAARTGIRAINAILMQAMITSQINKDEEDALDSENSRHP